MSLDPIPLQPTTSVAINPNYVAAIEKREEINLLVAKLETLTSGVLGLAALEELDSLTLRLRRAAIELRKAHLLVEAERAAKRVARQSEDCAAMVSPLGIAQGFLGRAH